MTTHLVLLSLLAIAPVCVSQELLKRIDEKDVTVEDLAHSFLFHFSRPHEVLTELISKEGATALQQALVEHKHEMEDARKVIAKARQWCEEMQRARTGAEFAAVLIAFEEKERTDRRARARHILAQLDADDRTALEDYLDTEYRRTGSMSRLDVGAMFASGPFPSEWTDSLIQRACTGPAGFAGTVPP